MSKLITENDLKNVLNKVLPTSRFGAIYSASWIASSSSANNVALTNDITIPAGNYVLVCYSPVATTDFSIGVAGHYKEMNASGDSLASIYSCNQTVTFHVQSAQSASVSFSYTERGGLYAIQICDANSNTNIADYIVEEGVNGDSTYRKWNSGIAECWIKTTQNVALNNTYGSLYQGTWDWSFPITFLDTPTVTCSYFKWGTGASWGTIAGVSGTGVTLRGIDAVSRASDSTIIHAYAIGKWK